MQGHELKTIREFLGLSTSQFAQELGYTGNRKNDALQVRRMEGGEKKIPLYIARLAWLIFNTCARSGDKYINWPHWPGYEIESEPDPGSERK